MSLYSMMFGKSHNSAFLLASLGLEESDFYRFRDCHLTEEKEIAVYTRGGGGNRECSCDWDEPSERTIDFGGNWHSPSCSIIMQNKIREHALYLRDEDDDFDSTYSTFYFSIPDGLTLDKLNAEFEGDEKWDILFKVFKS